MELVNQTRLRLRSDMFVNLAAGWIGLMFVAPGVWGIPVNELVFSLTKNVPLAILSLLTAEWLSERSKGL